MSERMPAPDEMVSSITTASFGSISPMALRSDSGCTGVCPAIWRALALSVSRSASVAAFAASSRSRAAARAARHRFAHRLGDVGQRCFRIAEDGDLRRIVLAELPRIVIEMDQRQPGRHWLDV